jgi:hypothetical protein
MTSNNKGQTSAIELVLIIPVIIAAIIVFILLVPNYSYTAGSEVNTFQLNAMAQSLLEYIITNPGNPPNWGLNASQLSSFGLAMPNQPYHLDPFKVMALEYWGFANGYLPSNLQGYCNTSQVATGFANYLNQHGINYLAISWYWLLLPIGNKAWPLSYTEVKQMLGLGSNYEFMLIIQPVLNITVIGLNGTSMYVKVTSSISGEPVGNASVSVQYFISDQGGDDLVQTNSSYTVISQKPLLINGTASSTTNASGVAVITLPVVFDSDNTYFMLITASIGGLQDYAYYQYPSIIIPLLTVGVLPNGTVYNSIVFVDPHVVSNCLYNTGLLPNPGATALGLRIVAVYKTLYGYTFESLNFTLNPGKGAHSYPIPCTLLAQSQSRDYSTCYWNLPNTPLLLIVNVVRNSQGQAGQVPLAQSIIVPYGLYPNYLLSNGPIVFGRSIEDAPVGVARALVYIGDSAYYITLYLYYGGNVFSGMASASS